MGVPRPPCRFDRGAAVVRRLLVTFDVEELDWGRPRAATTREASAPSAEGLERLVPLLGALDIRATCFVTATFARARPALVRTLAASGHEVGSHGLEHRDDCARMLPDLAVRRLTESRAALEDLTGAPVRGLRTPRLAWCPAETIAAAGFSYDASPHPTWVGRSPGRVRLPRPPWREAGIVRVPLSVVPLVRLPVAWYVFRALGERATSRIARLAGAGTPWIHLYFHPWEGSDLRSRVRRHVLALGTGPRWVERLGRLLGSLVATCPAATVAEAVDAWLAEGDGPSA